MDTSTMRSWATFYVDTCEWAVIPLWFMRDDGLCGCGDATCTRPGKHPWYGEEWDLPSNVADTKEKVEWFWADYPWNIGIICDQSSWPGVVYGGGDLLVIHANGGTAAKQLRRLGEDTAGVVGLPRTLTTVTPSGGSHLYFRLPEKMREAGGAVYADRYALDDYPGLSVLGRGGHVVAQPSVEPMGRWAFDPSTK